MPSHVYRDTQIHNAERDLEAIADGYEEKLGHEFWLADALQKDAIQNSWDARLVKIARDWSVRFAPEKYKTDTFLVIEDSGTTGLTGTIWSSREELTRILQANDPKENLAYFLSSNFSAKGSESGGKRGRGKSLFMVASQDRTFYFESLRADGLYVAGALYVGPDKAIHIEFSFGKEAHNYINEILGENPKLVLTQSGTRIYIKNPRAELLEAFETGMVLNFVEKTWWEIIKDHGASITLSLGGKNKKAECPRWYREDSVKKQKLETREYSDKVLLAPQNSRLRIKRLVLVHNPKGDTPEDITGIAIQRRGMTIERRPTEHLVKEEGMKNVYGWVEMDKELEAGMYHLEDVEHLRFKWTKNPAKDLLDVVRIVTRDFAKEVKLIESERSKQRRVQKEMEDRIARHINDFFSGLGFTGFSTSTRTRKQDTRNPNLPLRISLSDFHLPSNTQRVEIGDRIGACAAAINELDFSLDVEFKTWITNEDGETLKLLEEKIILPPHDKVLLGWDALVMEEGEFPKGYYTFRAKITLLKDIDFVLPKLGKLEKGKEIRVTAAFSVGVDPRAHGFIKFEAIESDDPTKLMDTRPENKAVVVEYNTKHSYIESLMPPEMKEHFAAFLYHLGTLVAFNQLLAADLAEDKPRIFRDIDVEDPASVVPRLMQEVSKFMYLQKPQ